MMLPSDWQHFYSCNGGIINFILRRGELAKMHKVN